MAVNRISPCVVLSPAAERPAVFVAGDGLWVGTLWIEEEGGLFWVAQDGAGSRSWVANGSSVSGAPNAVGFFNPLGTALISDPLLTAAPVDQYGRPQILDLRPASPNGGPVLRQGAWQADGDPQNLLGGGIVVYGPAPNGTHDSGNGQFGRMRHDRFGIRFIQGGVDIGYAWRVDPVEQYFTSDAGARTWTVTRATGNQVAAGTIRPGTFTVAGLPAGSEGATAFATNGRKLGEGPGLGTGVPVYWSGGAWRCYSTDAPVAA